MKMYTLVLSIEEQWSWENERETVNFDINEYTRGIFTSFEKAEEVAKAIMRGEIADVDDVKEISIAEFETDTLSSGLCVVAWALEEDKWFKYFEHKDGKIVSYRYNREICRGCPNLITTEESVFCKCDEDSTLTCPKAD